MLNARPITFFLLCLPIAAGAQWASFAVGLWALPEQLAREILESAASLGREVARGNAALLLLALALGPVLEEGLFRWALINALRTRLKMSAPWAISVSATAFGLAHIPFNPSAAILAFPAGAVFGWLYVRCNSLTYPIAAHMAMNAAGCAMAGAAFAAGYFASLYPS